MYQNPYGYGGYPPQERVIFVPTPPGQTPVNGFDIDGITHHIAGLEALKKLMKEDKKEEKKDDKKDKADTNVLNMALLMVLLSPITGPIMSHFFQWGLSLLH